MATDNGWWELRTTVKPNEIDLEHITQEIKKGNTSGEICADEADESKTPHCYYEGCDKNCEWLNEDKPVACPYLE